VEGGGSESEEGEDGPAPLLAAKKGPGLISMLRPIKPDAGVCVCMCVCVPDD